MNCASYDIYWKPYIFIFKQAYTLYENILHKHSFKTELRAYLEEEIKVIFKILFPLPGRISLMNKLHSLNYEKNNRVKAAGFQLKYLNGNVYL